MPCRRARFRNRVTCIQKDDHKPRLSILEADETKKLRTEGIEPRIHEDHMQGLVTVHCTITIWYTNLASSDEILAAKDAADKEWRELENVSAWNLAKVRNKSVVI